jgi:hypothetical protein
MVKIEHLNVCVLSSRRTLAAETLGDAGNPNAEDD